LHERNHFAPGERSARPGGSLEVKVLSWQIQVYDQIHRFGVHVLETVIDHHEHLGFVVVVDISHISTVILRENLHFEQFLVFVIKAQCDS